MQKELSSANKVITALLCGNDPEQTAILLREIMDEESAKDCSEMDCDLIAQCTEQLFELEGRTPAPVPVPRAESFIKPAKRKIRRRRFSQVAAAVLLVFVLGMTANGISVSAFGNNLLDGFIEWGKDGIKLHWNTNSNENAQSSSVLTVTDLVTGLKNSGLSTIQLPISWMDCMEIMNFTGFDKSETTNIRFELRNLETQKGLNYVIIQNGLGGNRSSVGASFLPGSYTAMEETKAGELAIYLFQETDKDCITCIFFDGAYQYTIYSDYDMEQTKEIMKTMQGVSLQK